MAYENSFLNNKQLCARNPISGLRRCVARSHNSSKFSSKILAMIVVLAIAIFVATVFLTVFVIRDFRRKKQKHDHIKTWKLTSFQRLDFTEANVLPSLSERNLIGSGGSGKVYRIAVNNSGDCVAVKKIWDRTKSDQKLQKQFLAEVQILGSIRHSNIVKLLCCISGEDSKLLVYEYMENQSLHGWLHGKKGVALSSNNWVDGDGLDWSMRMQIAIGAAQGLCYMHHECSPPIIHRDVKSSNILLDSEFKAKIADFGLAKILSRSGEPQTISAVAGSIGYIAPEQAYQTRVDEKIDVYSFGVVLLEMVTGREAGDGDEYTSLAEWAWKHHGDGISIDDALDKEIVKEACYVEEMKRVFKLGLICTTSLPSARPSMKDVLHILRRCAPPEGQAGKNGGSDRDVSPLLGNDDKYLYSYRRSKKVADDGDDSLV